MHQQGPQGVVDSITENPQQRPGVKNTPRFILITTEESAHVVS